MEPAAMRCRGHAAHVSAPRRMLRQHSPLHVFCKPNCLLQTRAKRLMYARCSHPYILKPGSPYSPAWNRAAAGARCHRRSCHSNPKHVQTCQAAAVSGSAGATQVQPDPGGAAAAINVPKHWQQQMEKAPLGKRRVLERYCQEVQRINAMEPYFKGLSDEQLQGKTAELKEALKRGSSLDELLAEAFATVREASSRVLGLRHFDSQMVGGMVLHEGQIAEMNTGEGKTLMATLPVYLNALTGLGVHVITVNDYLAARDAEWMGKLYSFLGLRCAAVQSNMSTKQYQEAYKADITYVTGQELCFDYLRDNTAQSPTELVLPEKLNFAVVDEVDCILIDESRNPMIISSPVNFNNEVVEVVDKGVVDLIQLVESDAQRMSMQLGRNIAGVRKVVKERYMSVDHKHKSVSLTKEGFQYIVFALLSHGVVFTNAQAQARPPDVMDLWEDTVPWGHLVMNSLKAHEFYKHGEQYVVLDDKALIIDESTGRVKPMTRYQGGIHNAIEAKEHVPIRPETFATSSITFQVFFRFYNKLAGMTGTAQTAAAEFYEIYALKVVQIPTAKPCIRTDNGPVLYMSRADKYRDLARIIQQCWQQDRPVLIGTTSVNESEEVKRSLLEYCRPDMRWHAEMKIQVLNAKPENVRTEAQTIAQAGLPGTVTIATNMAGRGTDIILGGNPQGLTKLGLLRLLYKRLLQDPSQGEGIPRMPIAVFNQYDAYTLGRNLRWSAESSAEGSVLPRDLHLTLLQAILMTNVSSSSCSFADIQQMAGSAMDSAGTLRRAVLAQLRSKFPGEPLEHLEYTICVAPAIKNVLIAQEYLYLKEPPGQRESIKAALYLWLWFDQQCATFAKQVKFAGGLLVIGTSVQESKRIELQLRGRSGRQGDPGSTMMMYDTEDALLSTSGISMLQKVTSVASGVYINGLPVEMLVKEVQRALELQWQMARLETKRYDEVVESYRTNLYTLRQMVLRGSPSSRTELLYTFFQHWVDRVVSQSLDARQSPESWIRSNSSLQHSFTTLTSPTMTVSAPANLSPLALLAWRLNYLVNPTSIVTKTAVDFKSVRDGMARSTTISSLLRLFGAVGDAGPAPGAEAEPPAAAAGAQTPKGARLPLQILEEPVLSPDQMRHLTGYLLVGEPLEWPTPRTPMSLRLKAAVANHRSRFAPPGLWEPANKNARKAGGNGRQKEREAPTRPEVKGLHAEKVEVVRAYLGEALIYVYELRKLGLKKALMSSGIGMLDLDADAYLASYEQHVMLDWMDGLWSSFLEELDRIRRAVQVKSFGNFSPLEEFRMEANRAFLMMLQTYREVVVEKVFTPDFRLDMWDSAQEDANFMNSGSMAPALPPPTTAPQPTHTNARPANPTAPAAIPAAMAAAGMAMPAAGAVPAGGDWVAMPAAGAVPAGGGRVGTPGVPAVESSAAASVLPLSDPGSNNGASPSSNSAAAPAVSSVGGWAGERAIKRAAAASAAPLADLASSIATSPSSNGAATPAVPAVESSAAESATHPSDPGSSAAASSPSSNGAATPAVPAIKNSAPESATFLSDPGSSVAASSPSSNGTAAAAAAAGLQSGVNGSQGYGTSSAGNGSGENGGHGLRGNGGNEERVESNPSISVHEGKG